MLERRLEGCDGVRLFDDPHVMIDGVTLSREEEILLNGVHCLSEMGNDGVGDSIGALWVGVSAGGLNGLPNMKIPVDEQMNLFKLLAEGRSFDAVSEVSIGEITTHGTIACSHV